MKKKKMVAIAFSFLLMAFPLQVFAAGSDLTKEITLTVKNEADSRELAEKEFPKTWKEGSKTYERSEITYKLIETKYLDKKEKEMELKSEPEQTFKEGKTVYTLKKTEKVEKSIAEGDVQTVTAYDDYDYVIAESDVPATKTVTETNRITGEPEEVICNLTGIHPAGMVMANNTMTVTFTNYDAAYYEWNGNYIPRRKIQNDYYIIPSSVHEVLILLADSIGKEELNQMIQEVNATVVESREILAEHCYKYDSKKNEIIIP